MPFLALDSCSRLTGIAKVWEVAPCFQQLLAPYNINFLRVN